MAEFCSICDPDNFDIDLFSIAVDLDRGHSENILCEDCNIRAVYKDETGVIYLVKLINNELVPIPVDIDNL